jgi:hypothetical protein
MLHALLGCLSPQSDGILLVRYFAAAFCFEDGQGTPIYGWCPTGPRELKDEDIDRLMSKRIQQTRAKWET